MIRKLNNKNLKLIGNGADSISSNSTSLTLLRSLLVPANSIKQFDVVRFTAFFRKSGTSSNNTIYLYWNTSASLTGAVLLGSYQITAASLIRYALVNRSAVFATSSIAQILDTSTLTVNDFGDYAGGTSNVSINTAADGYLIAAALGSTARLVDNITCSFIFIEI